VVKDPSEINGDNLNNVRHETSRYFRNKKRENLKDNINELATNSKNKNIRDLYRGINKFKRGYQRRNNLLKAVNGEVLADSHNILNRWKIYLSQLLNVHNVSDVRQIVVHTAEPLVPGPSCLEVKIAIAKLKKYKSLCSDQIPAELIQAGGEIQGTHKRMVRFQKLIKNFSTYTGTTYTVSSGYCPSFSCTTCSSLLMLTAGPRDHFQRWHRSRRRLSVCFV
jgi:hypothetical protein